MATAQNRSGHRPRTLFEKIWDQHVIADLGDGSNLLHIDRHIIHEITSARAFENLRKAGRGVRCPELTFGVVDHVVATVLGRNEDTNPAGGSFIRNMRRNCEDFGIRLFDMGDRRQGIAHVVGPELGTDLPGCTLVCGDSHTSSNGALGALAWGIGASEVEHVLATQSIVQRKPLRMRVVFDGTLGAGVSAKDMVLHLIGRVGTAGGRGCVVEFAGPGIRTQSIEGRLTICNMSIELGAKAGLVAPDDTTFAYLEGREFAPKGAAFQVALSAWRELSSDDDAQFDRDVTIDCNGLQPQVSWGTSPQDVIGVNEQIPDPDAIADSTRRASIRSALDYIGLTPGAALAGTPIDYAFIGSCTNGRLSDLRAAAEVARRGKVSPGVRALVVPGSASVKRDAEAEGLDKIFLSAGFEWHEAGCSLCVTANNDVVPAGKRCISSSNRNFEGRQGPRSRTHLASPATVAASAIAGRIADVRAVLDGRL
ncbi:3-isopropylmalate dehydratase large subunit [Bosea sp. BK604]|uniref:3-isopropylmalate dehydratase large subunit n=1 Tax=Bosea sp. BK604 TaxID=2512180 RepID=UPI00104F5A62|nr:3-isopropylmalate dehydratase large subunit [Bosea sp. BK604]TCR70660.1 3-isopropylmalate dehydratase large subunit [Bosea sp. BK604]